jgi:hypothetical protein
MQHSPPFIWFRKSNKDFSYTILLVKKINVGKVLKLWENCYSHPEIENFRVWHWSVEQIGRSISWSFEFFPRAVFFATVQAKTGLTDFPDWSDWFRPVGCQEGFLSKGVSVALWLLLFRCGKALEVFWVSGEFLGSFWTKSVWPVCQTGLTGFPCLCETKFNRSRVVSVSAACVLWLLVGFCS